MGMFPEMLAFSLRAYQKVVELLPQRRYDIIHDNQTLAYGTLLLKALGLPVVATVHHPLPIDRQADLAQLGSLGERLRRIMFYPFLMQHLVTKRLDRVITVSHSSAQETQRAFKVPQDKLRVVYNGIDTEVFRPGGPREPGRLIVCANTRDRKKGILYLLQALRLLKGEAVKLTIVDKGLPDNEFTLGLVKSYGLESVVTFTGHISPPELARHYASAQVSVTASLYEGFGFPAAEAMACGLPVVATTAGALPEVVAHGETGILVPPKDPPALAQAIRRLLFDDELRRRMGEAGRRRVEALFTWPQAARRTVEVYQEVL